MSISNTLLECIILKGLIISLLVNNSAEKGEFSKTRGYPDVSTSELI